MGTPEGLHHITVHLPPDAPLLERLDVIGAPRPRVPHDPPLTTALFTGDLSSLRVFRLKDVRTELLWRNMVNLTSVVLRNTSQDSPSMRQLLDFFEGAPRLRKIKLDSATPTTGGQRGRLVSLACLKRMDILWGSPPSLLLNHLVIPVGAKLSILGDLSRGTIGNHLPESLDNIRNVSDITKICFHAGHHARIKLSGPSGQLKMASRADAAHFGLESLAQLDTSEVERLEVSSNEHPLKHLSYRGLLPLGNLRVLTFSRCRKPYASTAALGPNAASSGFVACPKLEEMVLIPRAGTEIDIKSVTKIAAARASGGARLKTIKIGGEDKFNPWDVLELRKYVSNVEWDPVVDVVDSDGDDSDEDFNFW